MDLKKLSGPFPATAIKWRVGATTGPEGAKKGIALAYLDARDVMERLDEVVLPENWQAEYPFVGCCRIGIRFMRPAQVPATAAAQPESYAFDWVWKANGAGQSDIEGEKGQFSDAFKRAAVLWGVGRYLYDLPNTWFPIEKAGNSHRFTKEAEADMTQRLAKWQEQYFKKG